MFLWFSNNKLLTCVSVLCACFFVSTVVLGTRNRKATDEDQEAAEEEGSTEMTLTTLETPRPIVDYRLPEDVVPLSYDLYLHPDFNSGLFLGTVNIRLSVRRDRKSVVLHAKGLNISSTSLTTLSGTEVAVASAEEDYDLEQWIVYLKSPLPTGNYTLTLRFRGNMKSTDIVGLYMSSYATYDDKTRYLITPV